MVYRQDAEAGAAGVPWPDAPWSLATSEDLPALRESVPHLKGADIRRADTVYDGIGNGPSMRLIRPIKDVEAMLVHGLWVGQQRGGGGVPRPA